MSVRFSGSPPGQQSKHGPHTEVKIQKPPYSHHPLTPPPSPALPARPHLPFTLCALTSLPMRVIGISKRWPEGHTASPRKPNWRKSWSTAQQGWESPQLYIHTFTFFHSRSVSILSLFQRRFIITRERNRNILHWNITSPTFPPSSHHHFLTLSLFHNFILVIPLSASCFYLFI